MDTEAPGTRPLRRAVTALYVSVALSVLFAALTVLFRADVVAYQAARGAGEPGELAASVWIRAGAVAAAALLYLWLAGRLRAGRRRAYLRVRALAAIGFVAVAALLATAQYPPWLRVVQAVQAAALLSLFVLITRPAVRARFPKPPRMPGGDRRAALLLALTAPLVAEVTLGSTPLRMIWLVLLWVPIYGAGVLLVRELAVRAGCGWPGILLLGIAYGVVEEGMALQALSSPSLYGAGDWAPRLLGLNSAYTEVMLPYHAVFSVAIPIVLTGLARPATRTVPYLRRGGLIATGLCALAGAGLLRVLVPPTEDPGYVMPLGVLGGCLVAVAALAVVALVVMPRLRREGPSAGNAPRPWRLCLAGTAAAFGFLALLYPFAGSTRSAFTRGSWAYAPMAAALLLLAVVWHLVGRWRRSPEWTDRHALALVAGALIAHTAFGAITIPDTTGDLLGLLGIGAAMIAALLLLARRVRRRTPA